MPTYAEVSSKLLVDAATFFRTLAEQNDAVQDQMLENAKVFDQMAELLLQDPTKMLEDATVAQLAGRLMGDAAGFFRTLAEQNEPIREQMLQNANVYDNIGQVVASDPSGIIDA